MNHTPNFQRPDWEEKDRIQMGDFNDMTAKIDTALAAERDARQSRDSTLAALVSKRGNCQVYYTTYAGTGVYGRDTPTRRTFPGRPLAVFMGGLNMSGMIFAVRGMTQVAPHSVGSGGVKLYWRGNTFGLSNHINAEAQMNVVGRKYFIVALIAVDE